MPHRPKGPLRSLLASWRMLRQLRGRLPRNAVLTADLSGALPDVPPAPGLPFSGPPALTLPAVLRALRLAADDPRVAHFHARLGPLAVGWAKLFELRRHLDYFAAAGKTVSFFAETAGPKELLLAAGFGLFVPPDAALGLRGFAASASFVRGVLDKIGVAPQVERIGKYKSAGDQLARRDMSDAQREVLSALLADIHSVWMNSVQEATAIPRATLADVVDRSPWDAREYLDAGLVTAICYESELQDALKLRFANRGLFAADSDRDVLKRPLASVDVLQYVRRTNERLLAIGGRANIAVIRAVGAITSGKSGSTPLTGPTVGSDTLLGLIRHVRESKLYRACLLRVDSPGGSALASDVVWSELRKLANDMPLVACQSDVAASGGYYLSMAAEIVSEPLTVTGSVGVVTAKPSLGELYKKIGYSKETISVGSRYAQLLVDDRPFTDEEAEYYRDGAQQAYRKFVTKAAESRGKTYDEMNDVAQGRVWTGLQAKERGLVDHVGGIGKAVEILKEKADIPEDQYVNLVEMRAPVSFAERIRSLSATSGAPMIRSWQEPLMLSEIDGELSGVSPLMRFVLDVSLAPIASHFSVLSRTPQFQTFISALFGGK